MARGRWPVHTHERSRAETRLSNHMKIGILGSGAVAQTLGAGFLTHRYDVVMGTRHADKLKDWKAKHPAARIASFAETAAAADIVVLAVKGTAALEALRQAGVAALSGK